MKNDSQNLIALIKKFEVVNKDVIQMSRRISEMKVEVATIKQKINIADGL